MRHQTGAIPRVHRRSAGPRRCRCWIGRARVGASFRPAASERKRDRDVAEPARLADSTRGAAGPSRRSASNDPIPDQSVKRDRYRCSTKGTRDADGCWRFSFPARTGEVRCPLVRASPARPHNRPTILITPEMLPGCCSASSFTVDPSVADKTRQENSNRTDRHRKSFKRRTAVEARTLLACHNGMRGVHLGASDHPGDARTSNRRVPGR